MKTVRNFFDRIKEMSEDEETHPLLFKGEGVHLNLIGNVFNAKTWSLFLEKLDGFKIISLKIGCCEFETDSNFLSKITSQIRENLYSFGLRDPEDPPIALDNLASFLKTFKELKTLNVQKINFANQSIVESRFIICNTVTTISMKSIFFSFLEALTTCSYLEILNLDHCSFSTTQLSELFKHIQMTPNLKTISLQDIAVDCSELISELPWENMVHFEKIDLSYNSFTSFKVISDLYYVRNSHLKLINLAGAKFNEDKESLAEKCEEFELLTGIKINLEKEPKKLDYISQANQKPLMLASESPLMPATYQSPIWANKDLSLPVIQQPLIQASQQSLEAAFHEPVTWVNEQPALLANQQLRMPATQQVRMLADRQFSMPNNRQSPLSTSPRSVIWVTEEFPMLAHRQLPMPAYRPPSTPVRQQSLVLNQQSLLSASQQQLTWVNEQVSMPPNRQFSMPVNQQPLKWVPQESSPVIQQPSMSAGQQPVAWAITLPPMSTIQESSLPAHRQFSVLVNQQPSLLPASQQSLIAAVQRPLDWVTQEFSPAVKKFPPMLTSQQPMMQAVELPQLSTMQEFSMPIPQQPLITPSRQLRMSTSVEKTINKNKKSSKK